MKSILRRHTRTALLAIVVSAAGFSNAQSTCQYVGNQMYCSGGNLSSAQRLGDTTYYNYRDNERARRQDMPSSSQDIGSTRFYDNGATRQRLGDTDFYSNGVTKQRIGTTDFYSNGKTCQTIGETVFCN